MPTKNIHVGNKDIQATGNVEISSTGGHTAVAANGPSGNLMLSATNMACLQSGSGILTMEKNLPGGAAVSMQSGPTGSISLGLGPIDLGPRIKLTPTGIEIAIGAPGAGSAIEMTPTSIKLSVAGNTFELTPSGLTESILEVTTRSATSAGHELKAAESSYQLSSSGETVSVPTSAVKTSTNCDLKAGAMLTAEGSAQSTIKGGVVMIN